MSAALDADISRSTQAAWKTVFSRPLADAPPRRSPAPGTTFLTARVHILGDTPRAVLIMCPLEAARRLAADFYHADPASIKEELVGDVFGELANMIGGLIKRHFPHSSRLSLPEIARTGDDAPEGDTLAQASFEYDRVPLAVRLVQNPS